MPRPVIALLTDFGTTDHYVAAMKGVALGICPDAAFVDITHDVPPQDVVFGALELAACYRYFPAGTVFLVVVDPGVGSGRRAVAASDGAYRFVAPDNGVLTPVCGPSETSTVVELRTARYALPTVSRTFEGRDRFAPAAAWLASGVAIEELGPAVTDPVRIELPRPQVHAESIAGTIVRVDRFGNLITNVPEAIVAAFAANRAIRLDIGGAVLDRIVRAYADVPDGDVCALIGSMGTIEISVNGGSAAERLGTGRGDAVRIRRV